MSLAKTGSFRLALISARKPRAGASAHSRAIRRKLSLRRHLPRFPVPPGQYAANDICQTCHQEIWEKHFAGTPHSALLKGDQHGC